MIRRPEKKLKPVTIMHSSKTETVRLPPEGSEGVTVHPPAVREKLPLNKKVREKRKKRSKKSTKDLKNRDKVNKSYNKYQYQFMYIIDNIMITSVYLYTNSEQ